MLSRSLTELVQLRHNLENSGGDVLSQTIIEDFVLGREDDFELWSSIGIERHHDILLGWTNQEWVALLFRLVLSICPVR